MDIVFRQFIQNGRQFKIVLLLVVSPKPRLVQEKKFVWDGSASGSDVWRWILIVHQYMNFFFYKMFDIIFPGTDLGWLRHYHIMSRKPFGLQLDIQDNETEDNFLVYCQYCVTSDWIYEKQIVGEWWSGRCCEQLLRVSTIASQEPWKTEPQWPWPRLTE